MFKISWNSCGICVLSWCMSHYFCLRCDLVQTLPATYSPYPVNLVQAFSLLSNTCQQSCMSWWHSCPQNKLRFIILVFKKMLDISNATKRYCRVMCLVSRCPWDNVTVFSEEPEMSGVSQWEGSRSCSWHELTVWHGSWPTMTFFHTDHLLYFLNSGFWQCPASWGE